MEPLSDLEVLPLFEERAHVEKRVVETSSATLTIETREITETLTGELLSEAYVVERRPVGRFVDVSPEVRTEGESTVYPVVEEVLVKRLMLREEVRITPRRTLTPFEETVALRRQQAFFDGRVPFDTNPKTHADQGDFPMTDRTLTSLYSSRDDAERARTDLTEAGVSGNVDLHDKDTHGESFMDKLKGFFGGHEDTHAYGEGISRGHTLLTANVADDHADNAARVLENSNAVDLDRTQEGWRDEGWTGGAARAGSADEQVIPIVEENLVVGKREVERGGVRVRSYVVEKPVSEQVSLREEHVSVERRPVDRAVDAADAAFQDREISLTETAEEAVVAKNAVVREELVVRKDTTERTEEVRDTVRRTEVEVDDTTAGGRSGAERGTSRPV